MQKYAKLKALVKNPKGIDKVKDEHIEESINNLAKTIAGAKGFGRFHLKLLGGRKRANSHCLNLVGGQCTVSNEAADDADFELVMDRETWIEIAKGEMAPAEAYVRGLTEVHGNVEFGKRLYAKAAARGGEFEIG